LKEYNRTNPDTSSLKALVDIDAVSLVKEFEQDEAKAYKQYNGKVLSVKGHIIRIEKSGETEKLTLGTNNSMSGVICELQTSELPKLKELVTTQEVRIKGICTGMLLDVILVRCVLE